MAPSHISVLMFACASFGCGSKPPTSPSAGDTAHRSFSDVLSEYGFVELRPPSRLLAPGTLVQLRSRAPLQARIICSQKASLGADVEVQSSDSKSLSFDSSANEAYGLDASALPILSVKAEYSAIGRVTMRLRNVSVIEIADAAVFDGVYRRTPGCNNAVAHLAAESPDSVSMIKSVLSADVSYGVDFKSSASLDAGARIALIKALAADIGADSDSATATSVSGSSLYWGVTDEVRLAQVTLTAVETPVEGGFVPAAGVDGDAPAPSGPPPQARAEVVDGSAPRGTRALPVAAGALQIDPVPLAE